MDALAGGATRLVAGNWKMNGAGGALDQARLIAKALKEEPPAVRVALFPPAPLIHRMAEALAAFDVGVGAQDCHAARAGAFTGDLSAEMLHDAGATLVILGHSERRTGHRESDAGVAAKVEAALRAGLEPVVCVGESLEDRDAGRALEVVCAQVRGSLPPILSGRSFALAYEPIWAIGSGHTPSVEQVREMHGAIHALVLQLFPDEGAATPVLYGGSVNAANASELLGIEGVDGALVGGASLKAADFLPIVRAA